MNKLLTVGLVLLIAACAHSYTTALKSGEELSEDVALRVSKEALKDAGIDTAKMKPFPYRKGTSVFARNTIDPNRGYVIWVPNEVKDPSYSVFIERRGRSLDCEVVRNE